MFRRLFAAAPAEEEPPTGSDHSGLRLVVLGAGQMGEDLLWQLDRLGEDHEVTLVERDPDTVRNVSRKYDIAVAEGDAAIPEILGDRCAEADVLFALTNDDATNILAALTAIHPDVGVRRAVVRLSDPRHRENPLIANAPEIETIFPEGLVADEILGLIRFPGARSVRFLEEERLVFIRATPADDADVFDQPIADIAHAPRGWILTGILRRGAGKPAGGAAAGAELVVPRGHTHLHRGDDVFAVGPAEEAHRFLSAVGLGDRRTGSVVIAGLGQVGRRLAEKLRDASVDVTVVKRSSNPSKSVPGVHTIIGDATDEDILAEAGVEGVDFFVAATDADEVNFMAAYLARRLGARQTVALHNHHGFQETLHDLKVDHPVSPGFVTAGALLKVLHSRALVRMEWFLGGGELAEFAVSKDSPSTRAPLRDLGLPETAIVGEVVREGAGPFVPSGDTRFFAGDRVAVFLSGTPERDGGAESLKPLERLEALFG